MSKTFNTLMTAILINVAAKIFTALGLTFVVYKGLDTLHLKFVRLIQDKLDGIPADILQLMLLGGFGDFLNWVMSGIAFAMTLKAGSKLTARFKQS